MLPRRDLLFLRHLEDKKGNVFCALLSLIMKFHKNVTHRDKAVINVLTAEVLWAPTADNLGAWRKLSFFDTRRLAELSPSPISCLIF